MQKAWNWIKDNAGAITATIMAITVILGGFTGIIQFGIINPMHQRFDAVDQRVDAVNQRFDAVDQRFDAVDQRIDDLRAEMNTRFDTQDKYMNARFNAVNQRFDAQDQRLQRLENDVSELRKLSERVSRNEGQIDLIRQQLQTADAPSP
jgi:tetrahydromethanopterin S-methyltransferase subunit G